MNYYGIQYNINSVDKQILRCNLLMKMKAFEFVNFVE
jgi:hypothetical protein